MVHIVVTGNSEQTSQFASNCLTTRGYINIASLEDVLNFSQIYTGMSLFGSKIGFGRISDLGLPYSAIWRCSRVRL